MAFLNREVVDITTDASGDGTGYTGVVNGFVHAVKYVKDGSAPYAAGVDVTITGEDSGIAILTETNLDASKESYPRAATHSIAGAASLYAAGGEAVNDRIPVAGERIKIVVASGGDTKTGRFHVFVGG